MSQNDSFRDLIRRVRAGDRQAEYELVERFEPRIRRVVRRRLTDPDLRRLFDSGDVCQSILGIFFDGAKDGQFDIDKPEQLYTLLSTMARNKLTDYARKQRAARRDQRRIAKHVQDQLAAVDPHPDPSEIVAAQDLLLEFRNRLTEEERRIADQRALGRSWTEIAAQIGGNPDALRMQLSRAAARVARELDMEE
jgi:RNA polymerase sigma factor (sigma-70 family)